MVDLDRAHTFNLENFQLFTFEINKISIYLITKKKFRKTISNNDFEEYISMFSIHIPKYSSII